MLSCDTVRGVQRQIRVSQSMCGPTALFLTAVGDWTWETVGSMAQVDVLRASTADGDQALLSFYYIRVRAGVDLNPQRLTFGDRLSVVSAAFDFGSQSVLTLHSLRAAGSDAANTSITADTMDLREFYGEPRSDHMHVECMNRWVSRSDFSTNKGLVAAGPVGFLHQDLPALPGRYSPRAACTRARREESFLGSDTDGYVPVPADDRFLHPIDVARDVNGVGLVHFAAFTAYVDTALHRVWLRIGRNSRTFLTRRTLDFRIGYFGNADVDTTLAIATRHWRSHKNPADEITEVTMRDQADSRLIAVAAVRTLTPEGV